MADLDKLVEQLGKLSVLEASELGCGRENRV
jgi:hypothetical protein